MEDRRSAEIRRNEYIKSWTGVARDERTRLEEEEREKQQHASSSTTRPSPAHLPNSRESQLSLLFTARFEADTGTFGDQGLIPSGSTPRNKNPVHGGGQQRPGRPFQVDSRQPRQNPSQRPQGGIEMQRLG